MNVLAFDNATATCSVALQCGERVFERAVTAPRQQAKLILPMIEEVLCDASLTLQDLQAVVFGGGPGSFTGIRIACSVAQGIGFATGVSLVRISSLAGMAQASLMSNPSAQGVLVAVDARVSQLYWAAYEKSTAGVAELVGEEHLLSASDVKLPVKSINSWLGAGDAWSVYPDLLQLSSNITVQEPTHSIARALLALAVPHIQAKNWVTPAEALPVYLR